MPHDWELAYRDAMLETDHQKLAAKIDSAIGVLESRLSQLSSLPEHTRERERIADALRTFEAVRRVELRTSA
jgi:uncharacterized protein HemX